MGNRLLKLFALLMALALLATGLAFAEDGLEIDGAVETEQTGEVGAAELDIDGAALVSEEPAAANATDAVKINSKNFPDKAFRAFVKKKYDANGDGKLSADEANGVTEMFIGSDEQESEKYTYVKCKNIKGVEFFPNLSVLVLLRIPLKTLDVGKYRNL